MFKTMGVVVFPAIAVAAVLLVATVVYAEHAWVNYHWARTANPFTLKVGDNLSSTWDPYLATSISDWSASSVLDLVSVPSKKGKTCRPTAGRIEACNGTYGKNGWLGIASVWVSGSHITQGTVKMNDSYYNTATYNKPAWRNLVLCQELGHAFGLDHQDEDFGNANLGTCMDYTNSPDANQHPNQHDYDMLETIYAHMDSTTTVSPMTAAAAGSFDSDNPREWGEKVRDSRDGRSSLHVRDLGNGQKVFTFVVWAGETPGDRDH